MLATGGEQMKAYFPLPLKQLPLWETPPENVQALYQRAQAEFPRKVIVLDDDPTGIQTVHGVNVYTDWSYERILDCFRGDAVISYILTNSRSFTSAHTKRVHREIAENICRAAAQTRCDFVLISRGDSTLRGHWPLETQVLAETLAANGRKPFDGEVVIPFFPEGGRFTFGNIHYVREEDSLIPASETEFARDATFGYLSSDLTDWCEEKTCGMHKAESCICITLEDIRGLHVGKIAAQLMSAKNFTKIIVNAVCYEDLKVFCAAYLKALKSGKEFLFRTAAAWPKILGGITDKALLTHHELVADTSFGGVILVGSYVNKTTQQLENLKNSGLPIRFIPFNAALVMEERGLVREASRVVSIAEESILQGMTVCIYTTRKRIEPDDLSSEQRLQMSVAISDAVSSVIGNLSVQPSFIVAKGGITSSDVGVKALRVRKAMVMGQIMPGIPVWMTGDESKFPRMPYVNFPGNVGEIATLTNISKILMGQ